MIRLRFPLASALVLLAATPALRAETPRPAGGPRLENFEYPFPVSLLPLQQQEQTLEMAYMDVRPEAAEAPAILLLHGKNFSGAYWEQTARALQAEGYRVVIPDQVGFGKSTKPPHYHYTFHQLAENTRQLLDHLDIERAHVLGHSMGGMLAVRFALLFPDRTLSLTLLNPIGLEDWQARGVPYPGVDSWYRQELAQTPDDIRAYQKDNYYGGDWRPDYDRWVELLAQFIHSPQYRRMAWNQALTYDMIFTQPVRQDFDRIAVPTLLLIGQRDRTALGKLSVPPDVRRTLGNYPALGRAARDDIPKAELVEFDDLGHLPHIEDFNRFIEPLRTFLARSGQAGRGRTPSG